MVTQGFWAWCNERAPRFGGREVGILTRVGISPCAVGEWEWEREWEWEGDMEISASESCQNYPRVDYARVIISLKKKTRDEECHISEVQGRGTDNKLSRQGNKISTVNGVREDSDRSKGT